MRADVLLLLDRVFNNPGRDRAWLARYGDGALLLRDVCAWRVARAVWDGTSERLFHQARGELNWRHRADAAGA